MRLPVSLAICAALVGGCASTRVITPVVHTTLHDDTVRRAFLESTLRVLDERPGYVDEFVALARNHPRTLDRFNMSYAPLLADPAIANSTAAHLAASPAGLRQVLISTMDQARERPEARAAIASAIESRSDLSAEIISERRSASLAMTRSTVRAAQRSRAGRENFLEGMRANSGAVSRMMVRDGRTMRVMTRSMVDAGGDRLVEAVQSALPGRQPGEPAPQATPTPSQRGGGPRTPR